MNIFLALLVIVVTTIASPVQVSNDYTEWWQWCNRCGACDVVDNGEEPSITDQQQVPGTEDPVVEPVSPPVPVTEEEIPYRWRVNTENPDAPDKDPNMHP